jgi:hypothetical protein
VKPRRAQASLTPETEACTLLPGPVQVSKAIDQELSWYFGYAESAHRLGSLALVPPYVAAQLPASSDSEEVMAARARNLVTTVQSALRKVPTQPAGVLRAVYTPRRWPIGVVREFGSLSAVAVRIACTEDPWPARSSHDGLEHAAAQELARRLTQETASPAALRKTARRLMGSAITAYVRARAERTALKA